MHKYITILGIAVAGAVVVCAAGGWLFSGGVGLLLSCLILIGFFMAVVQRETKVYRFLDTLLVGSALFGLFAMALLLARIQLTAHFTEGSPFSFSYLWEQDSMMMAAVFALVSFFGGLVGAVLKGFYELYGKKLDRVMLFAGPLLVALASLAVRKVKVGGTIMSALHGWPYPFVSHQVRDVLDDFSIDKWIFTPGSLYHYVVFNYLLYFIVFFFAFYAIHFFNTKRETKKINRTLCLFGLLALMALGFTSFLSVRQSYIEHRIARAGYCTADADCAVIRDKCPFSCAVVVSSNEAERIERLINSFPSTCDLLCMGDVYASCINNQCSVSFGQAGDGNAASQ